MSFIYNIEVKGLIKTTNKLSVNLCIPSFNAGAWMIAVSTVSFQAKENNLNGICNISTNLIKGQRFSLSNRVEIYNPTIATVLLKASLHENSVIYLGQNWFTVNELSDTLEIKLEHFENSLPFLHNTFLSFNVLLKKVK